MCRSQESGVRNQAALSKTWLFTDPRHLTTGYLFPHLLNFG